MKSIRKHLVEPAEPSDLEGTWSAIQARRRAPTRRAPWAAVAAVALAGAWWWARGEEPEAPRAAIDLSASVFTPTIVRSDDATIVVMPGARLVPLERTATSVGWRLERGDASFDVEHETGRTFFVDGGDARVVVVGTRFRLRRISDALAVEVDRGTVRVETADEVRSVHGGNTWRVADAYGSERDALGPDGDDGAGADAQRIDGAGGTGGTSDGAAGAAGATAANRARASTTLDAQPTTRGAGASAPSSSDATAANGTPRTSNDATTKASNDADAPKEGAAPDEDPLAAADRERAEGAPKRAAARLEAFVADHEDDARVPLALFMLARIHHQDLGDAATAATKLEAALTAGLPTALEERALARLVDCYVASKQRSKARTTAKRYVDRFPNGARIEQIRRWASTP